MILQPSMKGAGKMLTGKLKPPLILHSTEDGKMAIKVPGDTGVRYNWDYDGDGRTLTDDYIDWRTGVNLSSGPHNIYGVG